MGESDKIPIRYEIPFVVEAGIGDISVSMSGPAENMDAIIKYTDAMLGSMLSKIDNMGIMKVLRDRVVDTVEINKQREKSNERSYG